MSEETPTKYQKVKNHLKENKTKYIIGGASFVLVAVAGGGVLVGMRLAPAVSVSAVQKASNTIGDISESIVTVDQSLNIYQQFGGYACKIVQDALDPRLMWPKIKDFCEQVAEENDTTPDKVYSLVKKYWKGGIADVYGYHPQRYGVTTTG